MNSFQQKLIGRKLVRMPSSEKEGVAAKKIRLADTRTIVAVWLHHKGEENNSRSQALNEYQVMVLAEGKDGFVYHQSLRFHGEDIWVLQNESNSSSMKRRKRA
jgi:hypothetical protein